MALPTVRSHDQRAKDPTSQCSKTSPHILFIDAYDSFSNNIVALLQQTLSATVQIIKIDDPTYATDDSANFQKLLARYDAVVAGPGPGNPCNGKDVGLIERLWALEGESLLPVLGICLGFQSLCCAFGGTIERLREPRHGMVSEILHNRKSIFRGIKGIEATNYHSLHANIGHPAQVDRAVSYPGELWTASQTCPLLEPLAWDCGNLNNGAVLMGTKHLQKPFWGLQYHPESICTNEEGAKIVMNWWKESCEWIAQNSSHRTASEPDANSLKRSFLGGQRDAPGAPIRTEGLQRTEQAQNGVTAETTFPSMVGGISPSVYSHNAPLKNLTVAEICRILHVPIGEAIVLESRRREGENALYAETAHFSIIACLDAKVAMRLCYFAQDKILEFRLGGRVIRTEIISDIWSFLSHVMSSCRSVGRANIPFWGGFMGYITYEAGLSGIGVVPSGSGSGSRRPDLSFAWVSRSVVIDHDQERYYVQSISVDDQPWVDATLKKLILTHKQVVRDMEYEIPPQSLQFNNFSYPQSKLTEEKCDSILTEVLRRSEMTSPSEQEYCEKVRKCKEYIMSGDSYELCLTSQTEVEIPMTPPEFCISWHLYRRLRRINPAPFHVYMRLGELHLLGSSPERFLSWNRHKKCQYRPIKGTVKKSPQVTRQHAEEILGSPKERAENLMIVDLIRHDLHGVVGSGNVSVKKLMGVEEYASVYQLVSVIEGHFGEHKTGIDALGASLPPGSMTGAPKRRSCEILKEIEENKPRGIYSGVIGYLDVGGGGDFSVVIRTAYRWEGEDELDDSAQDVTGVHSIWHIGAGGAVTARSTEVGEFAEMQTKLDSIARIFNPDACADRSSASVSRLLDRIERFRAL